MKISHVSVAVRAPERAARVLADIWGGSAHPGAWIAFSSEEPSSQVEFYPDRTELEPIDTMRSAPTRSVLPYTHPHRVEGAVRSGNRGTDRRARRLALPARQSGRRVRPHGSADRRSADGRGDHARPGAALRPRDECDPPGRGRGAALGKRLSLVLDVDRPPGAGRAVYGAGRLPRPCRKGC